MPRISSLTGPLLQAVLLFSATTGSEAATGITILPQPANVSVSGEGFAMNGRTPLVFRGEAAAPAAGILQHGLARLAGVQLSIAAATFDAASHGGITLEILAPGGLPPSPGETPRSAKPESYTLAVEPSGVTLQAADAAGLFYGVQTLLQLAESAASAQGGALRRRDADVEIRSPVELIG